MALNPQRRAFAESIGRLIADALWAELTSGNPAAQKCESAPADQNLARSAGDEREDPTERSAATHA